MSACKARSSASITLAVRAGEGPVQGLRLYCRACRFEGNRESAGQIQCIMLVLHILFDGAASARQQLREAHG